MRIDVGHREPLLQGRDPAPCLGLRQDEPVAVQVEQVVVRTPAGPGLVVLGRQSVRVGHEALGHLKMMNETIATVGILHRVDDDDRVLEDGIDDLVALRGKQVVGGQHRRVGGRDFVAVHGVGQPRHRRPRGNDSLGLGAREPSVAQASHIGLYFVDARQVRRRGNHGIDEFPALPALGIAEDLDAIRLRLGQRVEVADHVRVPGDAFARGMPGHVLDGRHLGVVDGAGPEIESLGAGRQRQQRHCGQGDQSHRVPLDRRQEPAAGPVRVIRVSAYVTPFPEYRQTRPASHFGDTC